VAARKTINPDSEESPMNCINSTLAVALLCASFGTATLAQDRPAGTRNPDKTKAAPSKSDVQQQQSQPSSSTKAQHPPVAAGEVRDWRAIDKNHDNLISPEEMEAALKQPSSQTGKSGQSKP